MPELPEVETVVTTLKPKLINHTLKSIVAIWPKSVEMMQPFQPFRITQIQRRGKYIILIGKEAILSIHLRMTGRLVEKANHTRFVRAQLIFDHLTLNFEDMRKFGRIIFSTNTDINSLPGIKILGPEPWDDNIKQQLSKKLVKATTTIKTFLLNQKNIAGIGNIYADEICFHAGINPKRQAKSLTSKEIAILVDAIHFILNKAIKLRGTTFAHFVDANGKKGNNFEYLQVYGRKNEACFKCQETLQHTKVQGRTTIYCANCQS